MTEIMARVRRELGSDAVILSTKSLRQPGFLGFFMRPLTEVAVAYEDLPARNPHDKGGRKNKKPMTNQEKAVAIAREVVAAQHERAAQEAREQAVAAAAAQEGERVSAREQQAREQAAIVQRKAEQAKAALHAGKTVPPAGKPAQAGVKAAPTAAAPPAPVTAPAPAGKAGDGTAVLADLTARLERFGEMLSHIAQKVDAPLEPSAAQEHAPAMQPFLQQLLALEVQQDLAHAVISRAEESMRQSGGAPREAVRAVLVEALGKPSPIKLTPRKQTVVMLCGPTGVGKTTSLIKLAAQTVVKHDVKAGLINADTYRIGAKEQIAAYADILQAPLRVVYDLDDLPAAMAEMAGCDVVFIDTPGKKPSDESHKSDILRIMQACSPDLCLLAISASTSNVAAREVMRHYQFLAHYGLLITKMDEVPSAASAINARFFSKMPLAYVAWGQDVPGDLSAADPQRIADALLGDGTAW